MGSNPGDAFYGQISGKDATLDPKLSRAHFPMHQELANLPTPDSIDLRAPIFTNAQGNKKATNIRTKAMVFLASSFGWQLASNQEADAFATYGGYQVDRSTVCDTALIPEMEAGNGFYAGVRTYKSLLE